ncbi:hypothetical protein FOF48_31735 [Corallococcus sp. Z5C101001]|nr:hypothetical protein FOF48_31735 [Corallococcus sp. Z5C101001]
MLGCTMATITIDVSATPITYDPGREVKHGDEVIFELGAGPTASATITFPIGSCFTTTGPYSLGGHTLRTDPLTVSPTARRGPYLFDVETRDGAKEDAARAHPHERDRKNGGIEVTSDPPEEFLR